MWWLIVSLKREVNGTEQINSVLHWVYCLLIGMSFTMNYAEKKKWLEMTGVRIKQNYLIIGSNSHNFNWAKIQYLSNAIVCRIITGNPYWNCFPNVHYSCLFQSKASYNLFTFLSSSSFSNFILMLVPSSAMQSTILTVLLNTLVPMSLEATLNLCWCW